MKIDDDLDLKRFLEDGLRTMYQNDVKSIAILATMKNDEVLSGYYHCNVPTKLLYAGYLQQDATLDTLRKNGIQIPDDGEEFFDNSIGEDEDT